MQTQIRIATPEDAESLVRFVGWAGEGMAELVWAGMAEPGQSVADVGHERARREEGSFSYRNAMILEDDGAPVSGIIGYSLPDDPVEIGPGFPAAFVPLQELENMAPGHWYVNVLATVPDRRGQGLGGRLLAHAEGVAKDQGCPGMAIIAFASNPGAVRLYQRTGYDEIARRVVEMPGWGPSGTEAILLVKSFADA